MNKKYYIEFCGEKHAELVEKYMERIDTTTLVEHMLSAFKASNDKIEIKDGLKDVLSSIINIYREGDYSNGIIAGTNHYETLKSENGAHYENCDYVKAKDFTIMLDFTDNDFGGFIRDAAEEYVQTYMSIIKLINMYSKQTDSEGAMRMVEGYIHQLESMESVDYISMFISTSFVSKYIDNKVSDSARFKPQTLSMEEYSMDSFIEKAKKCAIEYLNLDDSKMYRIGTFNEIEAHVVETYKEQQSKGEGKTLNTCWLNGEVLFISMKDGKMKCWVQ